MKKRSKHEKCLAMFVKGLDRELINKKFSGSTVDRACAAFRKNAKTNKEQNSKEDTMHKLTFSMSNNSPDHDQRWHAEFSKSYATREDAADDYALAHKFIKSFKDDLGVDEWKLKLVKEMTVSESIMASDSSD
jgi:hypothetical protein